MVTIRILRGWVVKGEGIATFEVGGLLLAEHGADFADSRRQRDLEVLRHGLLAAGDGALLGGFAHHALYALDGLLALLERLGDVLGKVLDLALLPFLDGLIVEAGQHMLLVELVQLARLLRNVGEGFGDFVLDIEPARRQQIHLNHSIAVVFVGTRGHEPLALLGHAALAEAIGGKAGIARLLGRVVRVGLAVGDEAVGATSARSTARSAPTYG